MKPTQLLTNVLAIFLLLLSVQSSSYADNQSVYRNFWHPNFRGERLNYCSFCHKGCGAYVAHRYCRLLGYERASQYVIAHNVGLTHFLDFRATCQGWRCNGFMTITCMKHLSHYPVKPYHYRQKQLADPRYNGYRVAWCYQKNQGCGARAAHSFCKRMGFIKALRFIKETQVDATKYIGSQELCFGKICDGFKMIICSR
jgi:hypothetical protein